MNYCKFCREKIKMTQDNCLKCGNYATGESDESRLDRVDIGLKIESKEETLEYLEQSGLSLGDWELPPWLEFGKVTKITFKDKERLKESVLAILGWIVLISRAFTRGHNFAFFYLTLALVIILIRTKVAFIEALKFENPLNEKGHLIRYNKDNAHGGSGLETFILGHDDFSEIKLTKKDNKLETIEFDHHISYVSDYNDLDFLERFINIYALKFNKRLIVEEKV